MLYAAAFLSLFFAPCTALWRQHNEPQGLMSGNTEFMTGKANFSDSNVREVFLQTMKTPREGDKLNMASRIRDSFHSIDANFGRVPAKNGVAVSVSYREACMWCYNFEKYLSPDYETFIILNRELALIHGLPKKVQTWDRKRTLGAHVVVTDDQNGEMFARQALLHFVDHFAENEPKYLLHTNCDQTTIPKEHKFYKSFPQVVHEMAEAFEAENKLREAGNPTELADDEHYADPNEKPHPILAMNPVLVEGVPHMDTFDDLKIHALDLNDWSQHWDQKPEYLTKAGKPWLQNATYFFEDHITMLDIPKLRQIQDRLFLMDSITEINRALPLLAKSMGWVTMRHNEVVILYDNHDMPADFREVSGLSEGQIDHMRVVNLELMAGGRAPKVLYEQYYKLKDAGIAPPRCMVGSHLTQHWRNDYEAHFSIIDQPITSEYANRWVRAGLDVAGYEPIGYDENGWSRFEVQCLPGVSPLVMTKNGEQPVGFSDFEPGHIKFLELELDGETYTVYSYAPAIEVMTVDYWADPAKSPHKILSLPMFNNTIVKAVTQPLRFKFGVTEIRKPTHPAKEFEQLGRCTF